MEEARQGNRYNQNFEGKFCGCEDEYDPQTEKGTMFQCLGLGTVEDGGCGEDWWHPECLIDLPRVKHEAKSESKVNGQLEAVKEESEHNTEQTNTTGTVEEHSHDGVPAPDGFPDEEEFDHLICYKCINAFPWIKQYAGSRGFLTAGKMEQTIGHRGNMTTEVVSDSSDSRKRKAEDDLEDSQESKRAKSDTGPAEEQSAPQSDSGVTPKHATLPPAPKSNYTTLFLKEDFRDHLCRCQDCFPLLAKHKQLLEEEESYEPPVSESDGAGDDDEDGNRSTAARSVNSGSLLERGEAALSSMDRVRAIEGVMAYNHVKDKVKAFLQPFAESGQPVGAEDIKTYFAKLRGDEQAMREATVGAEGGGGEIDSRREQGGY